MNIIKSNVKWTSELQNRFRTDYIVLHHASAVKYSFEQCHHQHTSQGWSGIGYHFYITKDGTIYEGRPINKKGAHVSDYNSSTIGICCEGNYEIEKTMPEVQKISVAKTIEYIKNFYPNTKIVGHKELSATACPGKYYPLNELKDYKKILDDIKEKEVKVMYKTLNEVPSYYKEAIEKLVNKGALKGDESGQLNLSEDMCRILTVLDRLNIF